MTGLQGGVFPFQPHCSCIKVNLVSPLQLHFCTSFVWQNVVKGSCATSSFFCFCFPMRFFFSFHFPPIFLIMSRPVLLLEIHICYNVPSALISGHGIYVPSPYLL